MSENRIIVNAPAKINWYLNILDKKSDGYHNIQSVMQTIDLYDTLEINKIDTRDINIIIEGKNKYNISIGENNLITKAAKALGVYGIEVKLTKRIPVEAGLGGGSSDAAATISALNDMFELGYKKSELAEKAAKIGADVPFFIYGGACIAEGIGEILTPIEPVKSYDILIEKPEIGLSTKMIYELMDKEKRTDKIGFNDFISHFNNDDKELI